MSIVSNRRKQQWKVSIENEEKQHPVCLWHLMLHNAGENHGQEVAVKFFLSSPHDFYGVKFKSSEFYNC